MERQTTDDGRATSVLQTAIKEMEKKAQEVEERRKEAEERVAKLEEEGKVMREAIRQLTDRREEMEWAMKKMEEKLEEEKEARKEEMAKMEKRLEKKMKEKNNGGEERVGEEERRNENGGGGRINEGDGRQERARKKCVIISDSNGREATQDSIRRHIPAEQRDDFEIANVVAYTLQEASDRVGRGQVDVRGAKVIIDNLTNDVRGSRLNAAVTPEELVRRVDRLRRGLMAAGAASVVTCQIKPMQVVDVTPHSDLLHEYLRAQPGGHGCRTQIRLEFLKHDGFHVKPQFDSVIDKGYACAILGEFVPNPTPRENFLPDSLRRRREAEWPRLPGNASRDRWGRGEGMTANVHGWQW